MNIQYGFKNKSVLVTGGAQGIGFEIAKTFLGAGARVAIWVHSEAALAIAKNELASFGAQVFLAKVDVADFADTNRGSSGLPFSLDVLINNAGITRDKSFKKMRQEEWDTVLSVNLTGVFNVTKSVFEKFNELSSGKRIINISSIVGLFGNFGQTNYAATKAGVIGITKTWAKEFARAGFTVNAIAPGFIETAMTQKMPEETLKAMAAKVPLQRLGKTADIANACLFLAADEASYISGTVMSVDGALTI